MFPLIVLNLLICLLTRPAVLFLPLFISLVHKSLLTNRLVKSMFLSHLLRLKTTIQ